MKTRTWKNSGLYITVIVTAALAAAPLAAYAEEGTANIYAEVPGDISDNTVTGTDAAVIITDIETAGIDESEATVSNDNAIAETGGTRNSSELNDTQNNTEISGTQNPVAETAAPEQAEPAAADIQISAVHLSGLTILNSDWEHVTAYVTNTETGEAQKISMSYMDENTLEGVLTADTTINADGAYTIEAWVFGADGEVNIVYGSMTNSGDSVMTFTANVSATI